MFEELAEVDDAALIAVIDDAARNEAREAARRLAAIAELADRRCASELGLAREHWACDGFDAAAAEVAAALSIGHRAALGQLHQGLALRHRLPKVATLLADGRITARTATAATWRTGLIEDPDVLALLDTDLAAAATRFGPLSAAKLDAKLDALIFQHDPAAVRQYQGVARGCDIGFGDREDLTGTRSIWGRLQVTDAELLARRLQAMERQVCPDDPRLAGERRSQAMGVLAAGGTTLACRCGKPDCPAAGRDARADAITITVLVDHMPGSDDADGGGPDDEPGPPGGPGDEPTTPKPPPAEPPTEAEPENPSPDTQVPRTTASPAVIAGGGIVPTPLLTELVAMGATIKHIDACTDPEPGYRPSRRLRRYVRTRDMTCRFPGCNHPAEYADLDHTIAYGTGLTHPGNLKALCRKHHLLKTFWTGTGGWADRQHPDGTIEWTSPTGHTYHVPPGSRLHFPNWNTTTPTPTNTPSGPRAPTPERGLTMPTRTRTRRQQHTYAITTERTRNQAYLDANPPPF